jgi:hypothetical protein
VTDAIVDSAAELDAWIFGERRNRHEGARDELTPRFPAHAGSGTVAVSAPALAAASTPQRLLVMVFLYGGNDGTTRSCPTRTRSTTAVPTSLSRPTQSSR